MGYPSEITAPVIVRRGADVHARPGVFTNSLQIHGRPARFIGTEQYFEAPYEYFKADYLIDIK
jgi:hypothetical protein